MKYTKKLSLLLILLLMIVSLFVACKESIAVVKVTFTVDGEVRYEYNIEQGYGLEEVPLVPEREGYIGAWNIDDFIEFYTDTTVTAVYTKNYFTVTFKAGTLIMRTVNVVIGQNVTSFPPIPEREGYEASWGITDFSNLTVDTIVNAIYTPIEIKLTFKSKDNDDIIKYVDYGTDLSDVPDVPFKLGFVGVWDDEDFSNIREEKVINAVYSSKQITINYIDADEDTEDTEIVSYGELLPLPLTQTKEGFIFNGWYTDDGYRQKASHITLYDDIYIYAQWIAINHAVATDLSLFNFASLEDNTYEISLADTENLPSSVILPNSFNGKLVTRIADNTFSGMTILEYVIIPIGVVEIGEGAFRECNNLTSVNFAQYNRLKKVGAYAFYKNSSLSSISVATDIEVIGDYAFYECNHLSQFSLPEDSKLTSVGHHAFEKSNRIRELNISSKIIFIGDYAFADVTNCTFNFYGLNNLESVGRFAFKNCSGIEFFNAPNIELIGQGAFAGCQNLKDLTILADIPIVDYFDANSFDNSYRVEQISKNRNEFGEFITDAEGNYELRRINNYLPTALRTIRIKTGVINIADYTLNNCAAVSNIYIPYTVKSIGKLSFALEKDDNNSLIREGNLDIAAGSQLEVIGEQAFLGRKTFDTIIFPSRVKTIEKEAFLSTILKANAISFADSNNLEFIGQDAFLYTPWFNAQSGVVYLGNIVIGFKGGSSAITFVSDTKAIAPYAFAHSNVVVTVTIPSSIKTINEYAFFDCLALSTLTISEGLETIHNNAFEQCINLRTIRLPKSLKEIGRDVFLGCSSVARMYLYGDRVLGEYFGKEEYENSYLVHQKQLLNQDFSILEDEDSNDKFYIKWKELKNNYNEYPTSYNVMIVNSIDIDGESRARFLLNTFSHQPYDSPYYEIVDGEYIFTLALVRTETTVGYKYTSSLGDSFYCSSQIDISELISIEVFFENDYFIPTSLIEITIIDDNFSENRVIVPYAFMNVSKLEKITLAEGIKEIGMEAFKNCTLLGMQNGIHITINLPSSLLYIGKSAFENAVNLQKLDNGLAPKLILIDDYAFRDSGLSSFEIPQSVRTIGKGAFKNVSNMNRLIFEEALVDIDNQGNVLNYLIIETEAFADCAGLVNIVFPDRLVSIKANAFIGNLDLSNISFTADSQLKELGSNAFANCSGLVTIILPKSLNLDTVDQPLWGCCNLKTLTLYNLADNYHSTTLGMLFGNQSYNNSYKIEQNGINYYIPNSLNNIIFGGGRISDYTFQNVTSLRNINLIEITQIGEYAFDSCNNIEEINLPSTVFTIGTNAFSNCSSMVSFNIEEESQLMEIGEYAFWENQLLEQFYFPAGVEEIKPYTFYGCGNLWYVDILSITEIGEYAFYNCTSLNGLDLAENINSIGQYAFYNCSNAEVFYKVFNQLKHIGSLAFYNCLGLKYLHAEEITQIGAMAFQGAYNLQELSIPSVEIGQVFGTTYFENSYTIRAEGGGNYHIPLALGRVRIAKGTLYLPDSMFRDCLYINDIIFLPSTPPELGELVFENISPELKLLVPHLSKEKYINSYGIYVQRIFSNPTTIENIEFSLNNDNTYTLTSLGEFNQELLYIPSNYNNKPVSKIGENILKNNNYIIELIIPNTIIEIEASAFEGCINLERIVFEAGSNLSKISNKAFYKCDNLISLIIPKSVRSIGDYAFGGYRYLDNDYVYTSKLSQVVFEKSSLLESIGRYAFYLCKDLEYIVLPDSIQEIGKAAFRESGLIDIKLPSLIDRLAEELFYGCSNLQEIEIPYDVKYISKNAFYQCFSLRKVQFNNYIKEIGERAFYSCLSLSTLNIPQSIEKIDKEAFAYCTALEDILLAETLHYIGNYAFNGCSNLYKVVLLNQNISYIGEDAFLDTLWYQEQMSQDGVFYINNIAYAYKGEMPTDTTLSFKLGTTAIAAKAFEGQTNIVKVIIPESITTIGAHAFSGCSALQTVIFDANSQLKQIEGYAFYQTHLNSIAIPESVEEIGGYVLYGISSLTSLILGGNLLKIGDYSFAQLINLDVTLTLPSSLKSIGEGAFYNSQRMKIKIPYGSQLIYLGNKAFSNTEELEIVFPQGINVINNAFSDTIMSTFVIPSWVISIAKGAFENSNIGHITIEENNNLMDIAEFAFYNLNNTNITLHQLSKLHSIGEKAFYNCNQLSTLVAEGISEIGEEAFYNCHSLEELSVNGNALSFIFGSNIPTTLKIINIASGVTVVNERAFENVTSIERVNFAATVKSISRYAFRNAENLQELRFEIAHALTEIGKDAFYGTKWLQEASDGVIYIGNIVYTHKGAFSDYVNIIAGTKAVAEYAFFNSNIREVRIPSSVVKINEYAFAACSNLNNISFESGSMLSSIEEKSFMDCIALSSVTLPLGVEHFGSHIFSGCWSISALSYNGKVGLGYIFGSQSYKDSYQAVQNSNIYYLPSTLTQIRILEGASGITAFAMQNCISLESITIPISVNKISEYAFDGCQNMNKVLFMSGSQLKTIGDKAFGRCESLTSLSLSVGVESVGQGILNGCNSLVEIIINGKLSLARLFGNTEYINSYDIVLDGESYYLPNSLKTVRIAQGAVEIVDKAFASSKVEKVVIPNSLKIIKQFAFYEAVDLIEFSGVSRIVEIQQDAFNGCISLDSIDLGPDIQIIGDRAFFNCLALEEVIALNESCQVGAQAFYNTPWADAINGAMYYGNTFLGYSGGMSPNHILQLREGTTDIADYALQGESLLAEVRLPSTIKTIGKGAFKDCVNLVSVVFIGVQSSLHSIGSEAFSNTGIFDLVIPSTVKQINTKTFYGCDNLMAIEFMPNSQVNYIGKYAFAQTGLMNINIPKGVIKIDDSAFANCDQLQTINFAQENELQTLGEAVFYNLVNAQFNYDSLDNLLQINNDAFYNCRLLTKIVAPNIEEIALNSLLGCYGLTELSIPDDIRLFELFGNDENGVSTYYDIINYMGVEYTVPKSLKKIKLSSNTLAIEDNAFLQCRSIEEVYLSQGITDIGDYAFAECDSLTRIIGGENLIRIGHYAFTGCINLISSELLGVSFIINKSVEYIGANAFIECQSLEKIYVEEGTALAYIGEYAFSNLINTEYEIAPINNPLRIGKYAFRGNQLLESFVANNVIEIGESAFNGCLSLNELSVTTRDFVGYIFGSELYGDSYLVEHQGINYCIPLSLSKIHVSSAMTYVCHSAFSGLDSIEVITLSRVSYIGQQAFKNNLSLTEIYIPSSVITINDFAFEGCVELISIEMELEDTLIYIGEEAFSDTQWYQNLYASTVDNVVYIGKIAYKSKGVISGELILREDTTGISPRAFRNQTEITKLYLPLSLSSLGSNAFANCNSIEQIYMSGNFEVGRLFGTSNVSDSYLVEQQGQSYYVPQSLKEINIIDGATQIVEEAFANCTSILKANIALSVNNIGNKAFYGCSNISEMTLHARSVLGKYFGNTPYNNSYPVNQQQEMYYIPQSLRELSIIGSYIAPYALQGLSEVITVNMPQEVESVGNYAFAGCENISSINLYNAVYIGDYAFADCQSISSLVFPLNAVLGEGILSSCKSLSSITIKGSMALHSLFGHYEFASSYQVAANNKLYYAPSILSTVNILSTSVIADNLLENFSSIDRVSLPDNIVRIGSKAFYGLEFLEEINLPFGLKEISEYAFFNNKRAVFSFANENVEVVGKSAFHNCERLTEFVSPSIRSIDEDAFSGCYRLATLSIINNNTVVGWYFGRQMLKNGYSVLQGEETFYIPNLLSSVEVYGDGCLADYMFANMHSLSTVKLYGEVAIPQHAFLGCTQIIELIGDNIIYIADDALMYLSWLPLYFQNYTNEVAYIGKVAYAYIGSSSILNIELRWDTTQIYKDAFAGLAKITSLSIPALVRYIDISAFVGCDLLASIMVDENNQYYSSIDGLLYNKAGDELLFTPTAHG